MVIKTINGENNPASQIRNLVGDIKILAQVVKKFKFVHYNMSANKVSRYVDQKDPFLLYINVFFQ